MVQANIFSYHVRVETTKGSIKIPKDLYEQSATYIKEKGLGVVLFGGVLSTGTGKRVYIYNEGVAVVGDEMNQETILLAHRTNNGLEDLAKSLSLPLPK